MTFRCFSRLSVGSFVVPVLLGVGVQSAMADRDVFLADVGGQVAIGSASDQAPADADLTTRVHARVLVPGFLGSQPFNPADYGLDEPGFFALPPGDPELPPGASALPPNAAVTVNLLPFTVGGNTDALFYWNGVGAVDFVPISASQPDVSLIVDPNPIDHTGANSGLDGHPGYRLDNGGAGVPADGVYLISPTVSVAGLADSPRIFLLDLADALVANATDAEDLSEGLENGQTVFQGKDFGFFLEAQDWVQSNLVVPEPSGLSLALVTMAALGGSVRRRRRA